MLVAGAASGGCVSNLTLGTTPEMRDAMLEIGAQSDESSNDSGSGDAGASDSGSQDSGGGSSGPNS